MHATQAFCLLFALSLHYQKHAAAILDMLGFGNGNGALWPCSQ